MTPTDELDFGEAERRAKTQQKYVDAPLRSSQRINKFPGCAHFPGTGPAGTYCNGCRFMIHTSQDQGWCKKWVELMKHRGSTKVVPRIKRFYHSCKYFEQQPSRRSSS